MLILSPAYGRDYTSKKAVLADWDANKDFIIENWDDPYCGKPVNKEQINEKSVQFRYKGMTQTFIHKV